ncbi:MAG TPA: alpha/beta hydrolase [Ktedonobacteraceae bacterium]|nr:alpha/beta hydrolase [Ktedonobacteraceae bacterium]
MTTIRIRPTSEAMQEAQTGTHYLPEDDHLLLHADPGRREAVTFLSDGGLHLAGHLYRPPTVSPGQVTAGIVMCGPISSVKEQTLPHYAERLADAGYTVLTFDSRNYGESEGMPRHHYDPNRVIADYSNAVSYLLSRDDIDSERVGVVGVCMGGGYAISTAALDKRIKAVASVAGGYNIGGTFQRMMGAEGFARYQAQINALHARQLATGEVQYIPTIARQLSAEIPLAVMPNEEAYSYYDRTSRTDAPNWLPNTMTVTSLEPYYIYNAIVHAPLVAPTPLLLVHGTTDFFLLPEYAQQVYDAASGPKELVWIETHNHIELYDQDPYVTQAVQSIITWLAVHLQ